MGVGRIPIERSNRQLEHPGDLRREIEHLEVRSFELVDIDEKAPAQRTISVALELERFGESISVVVTRVGVYGRPTDSEHEDGTWTITNHIVRTTLLHAYDLVFSDVRECERSEARPQGAPRWRTATGGSREQAEGGT